MSASGSPPVSPAQPRRGLTYTWRILLSVLGPSCFLPWETFQIETVHFVNRIPPSESMYHITSCVSHRYHCSSNRIHVQKRRTQSSTSYGNLLWPHTLKREKHSRICSIEPVDQVASSCFNIYNLFQPSANLFPRKYSGFIALGFLYIKVSVHFQAFLQVVPFAHRKKKR